MRRKVVTQIRQEIQSKYGSNVWKEYVADREAMKLKGMDAKEAAGIAYDAIIAKYGSTPNAPGNEETASENNKQEGAGSTNTQKKVKGKGVNRKDFAGKKIPSVVEVVMWVFDNWALDDVSAKDAPSSGAWGLLVDVRASATTRNNFFMTWAKLIPSKTQLETETRFSDDGREILGGIALLFKAKENADFEVSDEQEETL